MVVMLCRTPAIDADTIFRGWKCLECDGLANRRCCLALCREMRHSAWVAEWAMRRGAGYNGHTTVRASTGAWTSSWQAPPMNSIMDGGQ